jgi:hypothetical protein
MIGYVTIGALDSEASGRFYDAVFAPLGSERKLTSGGWIGYGGNDAKGEGFMACHSAICPPHDGNPARPGNGIMVAYLAPSLEAVKAAYDGGMKNGGSDEGAPGFRPPEAANGFFAAYLRDPTGNKLCIFCVV